ncbi:MAG: hypothetical protein M3Q95_06320 [Bacteroidota bacterium]|nr:hypothetical protein [Bacteroidota bacterium]
MQGGLCVNIEIDQHTDYDYYYWGSPGNTLYKGPFKEEQNHSSDLVDRAINFIRPGFGIGFLKKLGTDYAIDTDLYVSHAVRLDTYVKTSAIYPRIRVGFAF